ncbi:IucA/IucC family C-terminal-domain containing protein [Anaerobacillus sp. MEB173]|uniref:IucA/IucC family C-terminal-domain containing protein n=1 Tax=Anaerobacillus sp. MEB173 TaxID=3383345 RepID=UPI003F93AB45
MKQTKLTLAEKDLLSKYRISFQQEEEDEDLTISIRHLLEYDQLDHYIDKVQQKINAPNQMVASSMFSKRYVYLIAVPALYSLAKLNKQLNYSIDQLTLQSAVSSHGTWLPMLYFPTDKVSYPDTPIERNECREKLINNIFADHLNVMWDHLSKIGKISKQTLWENTAIYIFWLYESLLKEDLTEEVRSRVIDDFYFVVLKAGGHLFGNYNRNPLTRFYTEKTLKNGVEVRIRKTCCFYYEMAAGGEMCTGCPKDC